MALGNVWKLDKLQLPSSVTIDVLKDARWQAGIQKMLQNPSGHPFPLFTANQAQKPMLEFTTPQLDVILPAIPVSGAALGSTTTWFKLAAQVGNVTRATTQNSKIVITKSCAYWKSVKLSHNQPAEVSVVLVAGYDGVNDPFIYTGSLALPTTLGSGNWFTLGPVELNGSVVSGIKDVTIDSGIKLIEEGDSGEVFNTFIGVEECKPTVTVRTLTAVNWATLGLRGLALDGLNGLKCYARAMAANGDRIANATTSHVSFLGLNGTADPTDTSGSGSALISDSLKVDLIAASDSVLPLTMATGVAIV